MALQLLETLILPEARKTGVIVLLLKTEKRNKAGELVLKIQVACSVLTDPLYNAQYTQRHCIIK